jgi:hypothetical protein
VTFGLGWQLFGLVPLVPFAYHCLFLTDLGPPSLAQAVVSTLVFYLTLATSGLLLLVSLFTRHKRTLHDLFSGLVVVRRHSWREWALTTGAGSWNMGAGHPYT